MLPYEKFDHQQFLKACEKFKKENGVYVKGQPMTFEKCVTSNQNEFRFLFENAGCSVYDCPATRRRLMIDVNRAVIAYAKLQDQERFQTLRWEYFPNVKAGTYRPRLRVKASSSPMPL